jgi:hypothetical protein
MKIVEQILEKIIMIFFLFVYQMITIFILAIKNFIFILLAIKL